MKVQEVMTKNAACCYPSSSALTAATIMQQRKVGVLPVVEDQFSPRLVGVVTDRDLCLRVVAAGKDPAHIWISECMVADPIYCSLEDDVRHGLELMEEHRVRRVPVVNAKHELAGILSLSDLVDKGSISSGEIATALRTICMPAHGVTETDEMVTAA